MVFERRSLPFLTPHPSRGLGGGRGAARRAGWGSRRRGRGRPAPAVAARRGGPRLGRQELLERLRSRVVYPFRRCRGAARVRFASVEPVEGVAQQGRGATALVASSSRIARMGSVAALSAGARANRGPSIRSEGPRPHSPRARASASLPSGPPTTQVRRCGAAAAAPASNERRARGRVRGPRSDREVQERRPGGAAHIVVR